MRKGDHWPGEHHARVPLVWGAPGVPLVWESTRGSIRLGEHQGPIGLGLAPLRHPIGRLGKHRRFHWARAREHRGSIYHKETTIMIIVVFIITAH